MSRPKIILGVLLLLLLTLPAVHAQNDIVPIQYGDAVTGQITDTENGNLYSFEGQQGDKVTVEATSSSIDVLVRLGDSNGNILAENDDVTQNDTNAHVEFTLPEDGTYLIAVVGYSTGRYTLSLFNDGGSSQTTNTNTNNQQTTTSDDGTLSYGQETSGQAIDMENPVVYTFSGNAGDNVIINATSDSVDTYLVLADSQGNSLAENDDISQDDVNSSIQTSLPANGDYLIGVYGYTAGDFTLSLATASGSTPPTQPVADQGVGGDTQTGQITDDEPFIQIPITGVQRGQTITVDARATSGDLDLYIGLLLNDKVVAENDDRSTSDSDPLLEYPNAEAGDYTLVVTRYGFEQGETSGSFEVAIKLGSGGTGLVSNTEPVISNPTANGYPPINPTSTVADWTILEYTGADNNLEDAMINDMNEYELAGGSDQSLQIINLIDRSAEFDESNGNWTDTRLFYVTSDTSRDDGLGRTPTLDSRLLANLGELDTGYGQNLLDFLVWGIKSYPAQHYAIVLNDHGGGWLGTVVDDETGSILHISTLDSVFEAALQNTGINKFDLLINDSCLMSNVEHYGHMAKYFDYAIGSPETTMNPSFDNTLLANTLRSNPNIDMGDLGTLIADKYMKDMAEVNPDSLPILTADVTDLRKYDAVTDSIERFATVVNDNPDAYASFLGQVRANTYVYSFFLPEDQFGPQTNIDVGDFMKVIVDNSTDKPLVSAAQNVLNALSDTLIYGTAGDHVTKWTHYYNIYFPSKGTDFEPHYVEETPLQNWAQMLRNFYGAVSPQSRGFRTVQGAPPLAPSVVPVVNITNVFPQDQETSVAFPATISMEVTGRNISNGDFTVDQVQPDGTAVRLETSRIVTEVVENGVVDFVNKWNPGVDDSDFTWDVLLPFVTDGSTSSFEQIVTRDGVSSIAGRYQSPGQESWQEVSIIFKDDGTTDTVYSKQGDALGNVNLNEGGTFQTYRSVVTPDGRVQQQEGTNFVWPSGGISWDYQPAPSGRYNLGFLIQAVGGATGFGSVQMNVNNDKIDNSLRGYVDDDWGFIFQHPAQDWYSVSYFPDSDFLQTSNYDANEYMFVYPVYEASSDLKSIAQSVLDKFSLTMDGSPEPTTVDGKKALEFRFSYSNDSGDFSGHAFAIYLEDLQLGLVFSGEATDQAETDHLYQLFADHLTFFDAAAVKAQDSGLWGKDTYTSETHYPVREDWLPGFENGLWWTYSPENATDSSTFANVTVLNPMDDDDSAAVLDTLLEQEVESFDGYTLGTKETYYGELNTWESATFTHTGANGQEVTGKLYATVKNGVPYAIWFEAPTDTFAQVFNDVFTVMLDGFKIDDTSEADASS